MIEKSSLRFSCLARRDAILNVDHNKWSFAVCERLAAYLVQCMAHPSPLPGPPPEGGGDVQNDLSPSPFRERVGERVNPSIALYNPIRSELDITPVLHALYAEGVTVSLPVVESGRPFLSFFRFHSTLLMKEGAFGVLEPERQEEVVPTIVIVPLVGFDRTGNRIGYGKGYYDATLSILRAQNPSLLAIGVGFALQEVAEIPADPHDAKLDVIITETETIIL